MGLTASCHNPHITLDLLLLSMSAHQTQAFLSALVSNIPNKIMAFWSFHLIPHPPFSPAQVYPQWFPTNLCLRLKSRFSPNGSILHFCLACSCFSDILFYFPDITFPHSWCACFLYSAFIQTFYFTFCPIHSARDDGSPFWCCGLFKKSFLNSCVSLPHLTFGNYCWVLDY